MYRLTLVLLTACAYPAVEVVEPVPAVAVEPEAPKPGAPPGYFKCERALRQAQADVKAYEAGGVPDRDAARKSVKAAVVACRGVHAMNAEAAEAMLPRVAPLKRLKALGYVE